MVVMKGMNLTVNLIQSWFNINFLVILSPIFLKPFQTCGDTDTVLDSCSASAGDNGSDIKDSL